VLWFFFREKFQEEFQRESLFVWNTPYCKLLDFACHMLPMWFVRRLVAMLSAKSIVNRFYYISGQIRESRAVVRRTLMRDGGGLISGVCERQSKRGHFRTKMARIPGRNDRPMENTLRRERCANRQPSSAHVPSSAAVNQHFQTASKPSFWSSSPNTRSPVRKLFFFPRNKRASENC